MALHYKSITATLKLKSGLRIGGNEGELAIGGVEENLRVLRDPWTREPYIPGSSLKGKVRNLLELKHGRKNFKMEGQGRERVRRPADLGEPCMCGECMVCRLFGPHKNTNHRLGPSRLIVRDAFLTADSKAELAAFNSKNGTDSVETKTENMIDRRTGTALHPRTGERTLRDLGFDLKLSLRVIDNDDEAAMLAVVKEGFAELLPQDTLGSSGSRGYGEVEVVGWSVNDAGTSDGAA